MRRFRSYLFVLLLVVLLVLVLGNYLRSCGILAGIGSGLNQLSQVSDQQSSSSVSGTAVAKSAQAGQAAARSPTPSSVPTGIEGLSLRLSRPLLFDADGVRGLAATSEFFYVACSDVERHKAFLHRVRRDTNELAQSRSVEQDAFVSLGGIDMGSELLWLPLSQESPTKASVILGVDPLSLDTRMAFGVNDVVTAVVQGADGAIYGLGAGGTLFYVWTPEGRLIQQTANSTGIAYSDMDVVEGQVVATGVGQVQVGGVEREMGVIDVLDPATFALLVRHLADARSPQGRWLTARGFAFAEGEFHFLPDEGQMAMLHTYSVDGGQVEDYLR